MIINNIPTIESTLAGDISKVKSEENSTYGEAVIITNTLEALMIVLTLQMKVQNHFYQVKLKMFMIC